MFESITKKSFIDLLKKSENELIFSRLNLSEKGSEKVMQALYNGTFEVKHGSKYEQHHLHRRQQVIFQSRRKVLQT